MSPSPSTSTSSSSISPPFSPPDLSLDTTQLPASPPDLSLDITQRKCVICLRPAYSNNYGVLTCDACKMFFRRIVVLNRDYKCKNSGQCLARSKVTKCKGCRFQQCIAAGMTYQPTVLELANEKDVDLSTTIGALLFLDARRSKAMKTQFTDENFSLVQVVELRRMRLKTRKSDNISTHDWSFFGIYTSIEFLMSLDFMSFLSNSDKTILLKHFCVKASLFASAMRAMRERRDRLMTVDGRDVYPDDILKLDKFSQAFLNRIRSLLVARLIDLKLTNEEFALINVVFFCNPALPLSLAGQEVIASQQKVYTSALLQYCNVAYERHGPSRFTDLLSLFHVINKNFEDVQAMTMIFKLCAPWVVYKKIVTDVI